jgi:hypothetical protein
MPRQHRIPSYCHNRASDQAYVHINGKDIYLGRFGSEESKAAYKTIVRKALTDRAKAELEARVQISADLIIAELCASYLKHARCYYVKDGTPTMEYGNICRGLKPHLERFPHDLVTNFGPLNTEGDSPAMGRGGIVFKQVNKLVERVRRMFGWGVEE